MAQQPIRIAKRSGWPETSSLELHDREIGHRVLTHHLAGHASAIRQSHHHPIRVLNDMGVGQHQSLPIEDHTTALTTFDSGSGSPRALQAEESLKEGIH